MTVVVLLGAGASYGSIGVIPSRPPLGDELFSELEKRNGIAARIPRKIKIKFRKNFERGMAKYFEHSKRDIMTFQRELADYLASFRPTSSNIYIKLINELGSQGVVYSSLNYDLLFEQSANRAGFSTNYSNEYIHGNVRLLKIHGSSNFWPAIPLGFLRGCTSSGAVHADIEADVYPIKSWEETLLRCKIEDSIAPAIAMFAEGKEVRVCPDFVKKQYEMWKQTVRNCSHVFIVGVRVHEADSHIWEFLGKMNTCITYFGFDKDKPAFNAWKDKHNKTNAIFYNGGFEESVSIIKELCEKQ